MLVKEDKSLNKENSNQIYLRQIRNEYDEISDNKKSRNEKVFCRDI